LTLAYLNGPKCSLYYVNQTTADADQAADHAPSAHGATASSATDIAPSQSARLDPCWNYLCHITA